MLIAVSGYKNAGKDSIGDILIRKHGYIRAAFADMLKEAVGVQLGITREEIENWKNDDSVRVVVENVHNPTNHLVDISFRRFLQNTGNDFRKVFGENFWIRNLDSQLRRLHRRWGNIVVTDGRYTNERQYVIDNGGFIVWVDRPGIESDGHEGEKPPNPDQIIYTIKNDGTLEDLEEKVDKMVLDLSHAGY